MTESETATVDPSWLTYSDDSVSFRYPADLPTTYIHAVAWPPNVSVFDTRMDCVETTLNNGNTYCVSTSSEGAAGSVYIEYAYGTWKDGKTVNLTFTFREVQCANYDDPQKTACEEERDAFDVDAFADSIARTVVTR